MDQTVQQSPRAGDARTLGFSFTGTAREYFGIWIVNLFLSIITIGIYTAWAKVRRLRYFYGNTWLDGHNFEYHARPKQILIGRIIVVLALLLYQGLLFISPIFIAILIPYLVALPWLINKSIAFNSRMTSYRNVRLNFGGTYWGALGVFVGWPLLAMLTFGILTPYASRASNNYIGRHLGFGTARFATDAPVRQFYGNLGMTVVFMLILSVIVGGLGAAIGAGVFEVYRIVDPVYATFSPGGIAAFMLIGVAVGAYAALILGVLFYLAGSRNIGFNHTTLDGAHRLQSSLGRGRYVWILVSNLFVTIFTLGMMRPWAAIRTWRYFADHTALVAAGSLDHFIDTAAPAGNVAAAEFFDIEGIDFGL